MSPTVPLRSEIEKNALLNAIQGLDIVHDIPLLISPRIVATNVTSQFRLSVLDGGVIEIQRSGRGWGRHRTVASVAFEEEADFEAFIEMGSFSDVKNLLADSVLQQREIVFRSDSQVSIVAVA